MVLNYKGHPPFRKTTLSESLISLIPYAERSPTKQDVLFGGKVAFIMDMNDEEVVRRIMDYCGISGWKLVKWSEEGLPRPHVSGSIYVLKIPINGTVYIRIPLNVTINEYVWSYVTLYGDVGLNVYVYYALGGDLSNTRMKLSKPFTFISGVWAKVVTTWIGEPHNGAIELIIEVSGTGTLYIGMVACYLGIIGKIEKWIPAYMLLNVKIELSTETFSFFIRYGIYAESGKPFLVEHLFRVLTDGNTLTISATDENGHTIYTLSTTTTTETDYYTVMHIKLKTRQRDKVTYSFDTTGVAEIRAINIVLHIYSDEFKSINRASGSYTSDGDGTEDTVTLIDYTTDKNYHAKIRMVKATSDSNTTELKLKINGNDVWDFLNDGSTYDKEVDDVYKAELIVNDPGNGTTTTVSYVIVYEIHYGHIITH